MASPTAALERIAGLAIGAALVLFAAGLWAPADWRGTAAAERPIGWLLLAAGAMLMVWARRSAMDPVAPMPPRHEPRWSLPPIDGPMPELTLIEQAMQRAGGEVPQPVTASATPAPAAETSPGWRRVPLPLLTVAALAGALMAYFVMPRATPSAPLHAVHAMPPPQALATPQKVAAAAVPALPSLPLPAPETGSAVARLADPPIAAPPHLPVPRAGRQVLRCVADGRVTYTDADASCPEGAGVRITVFPTQGVARLR